ncbi:hypothetical protein [Bacteroides helcogenes]|uniref:Uncharacterized protein n=1 Tax=Bacteroides helcogenes (strain ATCC 35417 / DSM 20613 / JCM 6297 / CCUG 15421 / P 36-108) TaxID=693979 RepID=E6SP13_BACT6|nr:hypothetical protein [Bacteroides helcogenes]ADV43783.1 hypothetical protein Bache_1800 [Bacteroides helcogenes P 36-108]MDY5237414.1 hypothetical protein [Bacteroides helcogenes]
MNKIAQKEAKLQSIDERIGITFKKFAEKRTKLTDMRDEFINARINSDKIKPYADQIDFEQKFRRIIQKLEVMRKEWKRFLV